MYEKQAFKNILAPINSYIVQFGWNFKQYHSDAIVSIYLRYDSALQHHELLNSFRLTLNYIKPTSITSIQTDLVIKQEIINFIRVLFYQIQPFFPYVSCLLTWLGRILHVLLYNRKKQILSKIIERYFYFLTLFLHFVIYIYVFN